MNSKNLTISAWRPTNEPVLDQDSLNIDYPSFATGIVVGIVIALFVFILNIVWEIYKTRKQEKVSIRTIINELRINISILSDNKTIILNELRVIGNDLTLVTPIFELNHDFSSFLTVNCPSIFKNQVKLFEEVRKISKLTSKTNKTIQSRESYRINNGAMTNYNSRLKIYDKLLQDLILELEEILPIFINKLEKHT